MSQIKEKLSQDTLDYINNTQSELSMLIFQVGEISFKIREFKTEIEKFEAIKKETEEKFDLLALKLENSVSDLQKKYPNGEINLADGTISYES